MKYLSDYYINSIALMTMFSTMTNSASYEFQKILDWESTHLTMLLVNNEKGALVYTITVMNEIIAWSQNDSYWAREKIFYIDADTNQIFIKHFTIHTTYRRNNMGQKCEGNCGSWVLNEIIKKIYLLNSTANPANFHSDWAELAVLFSR